MGYSQRYIGNDMIYMSRDLQPELSEFICRYNIIDYAFIDKDLTSFMTARARSDSRVVMEFNLYDERLKSLDALETMIKESCRPGDCVLILTSDMNCAFVLMCECIKREVAFFCEVFREAYLIDNLADAVKDCKDWYDYFHDLRKLY